jgi:hypothetical protein
MDDHLTLLTELGEEAAAAAVAPYWADSAALYAPERLGFLQPDAWQPNRACCGLDPALDADLAAVAERIRTTPALARLAWHYAWRMWEGTDRSFQPPPSLQATLGDRGGLLYVLIALDWVPRLRAWHQSLGYPEDVTRATARQVGCFMDNYRRAHGGRSGIFIGQMSWLRNYLLNRYVRLGRFEFWLRRFDGELEVFRHQASRRVVALARAGLVFNTQGYWAGVDPEADRAGVWTATLDRTPTTVTGHPVSPRGHALREPVSLPLNEWQVVLQRDDPVLDMHIPAGGGMPPEVAADSFRQGVAFFTRHAPDEAPRAIFCKSWIFSPQIESVLPADSNLAQLTREVYLYPNDSADRNLWFVFFQSPFNAGTAPRDTKLQRTLHAFLSAGGLWRNGSMFILPDDLPQFGTQVYRRMTPATGMPVDNS